MQARPPQQAATYMDYATFEIPTFLTQGGASLDLKLAYTTQGQLSAARDNAILVLTSYSAQHDDAAALFALMSLPGTFATW
jgi:homoserine acetyltransferase